MGERGVRNAEVTGSIPVPSTVIPITTMPGFRLPSQSTGRALLLPGIAAILLPVGAGAQESANDLVSRIEARHRELPHFESTFEQRFTPRIFGRERVESGWLTVSHSGRMRWEYRDPEPKLFVSDGTNTWFHVPADRQVVVGSLAPADRETPRQAPNPLAFLTGEAAILDHFDAELVVDDTTPEDRRRVLLTPLAGAGDVERGMLEVEAETGLIRVLELLDLDGNRTTFRFSAFRVGDPPPDSLFEFRIPPGTDVVTARELAAGVG